MEFFSGVVSNYKKEVLSTTTGNIDGKIKTGFTLNLDREVSGKIGGKINTTHNHYVTFNIGDIAFRLYGDFTFNDGDEISVCANNTFQGHYDVLGFVNFTKQFQAIPEKTNIFGAYMRSIKFIIVGLICCVVIGSFVGGGFFLLIPLLLAIGVLVYPYLNMRSNNKRADEIMTNLYAIRSDAENAAIETKEQDSHTAKSQDSF